MRGGRSGRACFAEGGGSAGVVRLAVGRGWGHSARRAGGMSIGSVKGASRLRAGGGGIDRAGGGEREFTGLGGLRRDTEDWALC